MILKTPGASVLLHLLPYHTVFSPAHKAIVPGSQLRGKEEDLYNRSNVLPYFPAVVLGDLEVRNEERNIGEKVLICP